MGNGVAEVVDDNRSAIVNTASTVASMSIEGAAKARGAAGAGRAGGAIVTPAVWVLDYAVNGQTPDKTDVGLWALGLFGGLVGIAAAGTGIVKGLVDDDTRKKLAAVRSSEPQKLHPYILATVNFGMAGQGINAQSIASQGGTAWLHPNGLWAYLTDASGKLVCDYRPNVATRIYQPILPLTPAGAAGRYRWHIVRGGA